MGIRQNPVQAVIGELRERAEAADYDGGMALDRLAYGSFVSATHRYLYMETPKAACTSFKHLIAAIEGVAPATMGVPYHRETRTDMLIHQRRLVPITNLINCDAQSRNAVLGGEPGWMSFALVRNPFSRIVSFFENKVRLGEPGFLRLEARYGDVRRFGGLRQAFAAFTEEVVADGAMRAGNYHLMPQAWLILPRLIAYTHIFRLEAADAAIDALRAHVGGRLPDTGMVFNRAPTRRDWRAYYTPGAAAIVAEAYGEDFKLFGYDPSDWLAVAPDAESGAGEISEAEEYWRRELVARNAMIDRLYTQLGVPPSLNPAELRLAQER